MTATIHPFPRKRRPRSLLDRFYEMQAAKKAEQLQSELAVNFSDAIKARRERIRQQFNSSAGLAL